MAVVGEGVNFRITNPFNIKGLNYTTIKYSDDSVRFQFELGAMPPVGYSRDEGEDDGENESEISFIDFLDKLRNKEESKFSWDDSLKRISWTFTSGTDGYLRIEAIEDDTPIYDFSFLMTNEIFCEIENLVIKTEENEYVYGRGLVSESNKQFERFMSSIAHPNEDTNIIIRAVYDDCFKTLSTQYHKLSIDDVDMGNMKYVLKQIMNEDKPLEERIQIAEDYKKIMIKNDYRFKELPPGSKIPNVIYYSDECRKLE